MTVFESRLNKALTEAGMSRRDMMKRTGGTLASTAMSKGEIAQKIIRSISSAPISSAVFKIHEQLFNTVLNGVAHGDTWEHVIDSLTKSAHNSEWFNKVGIPQEEWRPDLLTPDVVRAYLQRLADEGQYQKLGWVMYDEPGYLKFFGPMLQDVFSEIADRLGGYPQLLRAVGREGTSLLHRIEVFKKLLPGMKKLIPFDALDATPEQLKQIEKLVGKRFQTDVSKYEAKRKKRDRRYSEKAAHRDGEPWIRGDLEGGMHQPFEAKLRRALSLV